MSSSILKSRQFSRLDRRQSSNLNHEDFKSSQTSIRSSVILLNCTLRNIIVFFFFFRTRTMHRTRNRGLNVEDDEKRRSRKNRGVPPSFLFGLYHPQRRIVTGSRNAGPGMNTFPGSPGLSLSRSKLYRSIRLSCYTLVGQKHEKVRVLAFFEKFVMVQLTWRAGDIVSPCFEWYILRGDNSFTGPRSFVNELPIVINLLISARFVFLF